MIFGEVCGILPLSVPPSQGLFLPEANRYLLLLSRISSQHGQEVMNCLE